MDKREALPNCGSRVFLTSQCAPVPPCQGASTPADVYGLLRFFGWKEREGLVTALSELSWKSIARFEKHIIVERKGRDWVWCVKFRKTSWICICGETSGA